MDWSIKKTLENTEGAIKKTTQRNWQHKTQDKQNKNTTKDTQNTRQTKQKHNTICVEHHYGQASTNNINKT